LRPGSNGTLFDILSLRGNLIAIAAPEHDSRPVPSKNGVKAMIRFSACIVAISLLPGAPPALAQEFKSGDITVERPWAPATPRGAEVGAGYFTIRDDGASPDRLTGVTADFATVELHEMKRENGVMSMPELKNGLEIPAHGTIRLAPGSYHAMFAHLKHPLTKGEKVKAVLTFDRAPPLTVEFSVERVGASGPGPAKGDGMSGMKM
jgi:copper(I)-binding protein